MIYLKTLLMLLLIGCGEFKSETNIIDSNISESSVEALQRNKVLIFYGRSGFTPPGAYGYGTFETLKKTYEDEGLEVSYTNIWPTSLNQFRLVMLAVPGYRNNTNYLSSKEIKKRISLQS